MLYNSDCMLRRALKRFTTAWLPEFDNFDSLTPNVCANKRVCKDTRCAEQCGMLSNDFPVTIIVSSRCYSTLTSLFLRISHTNKLFICTVSIWRYRLPSLSVTPQDGLQGWASVVFCLRAGWSLSLSENGASTNGVSRGESHTEQCLYPAQAWRKGSAFPRPSNKDGVQDH